MRYIVGAYASSPNVDSWDPKLESEYYQQLRTLPGLHGLEHPFLGSLHPYDDEWFLQNIDPEWDFTLTCIPGIMNALGENAQFGIASDDPRSREEAIAFMQAACSAVKQLNSHLGRQAVTAIQVQTAPNRQHAPSSISSLCLSLETMLGWDWQGAQILIEHCDTYLEGQQPSKGFLTLNDEIAAIESINSNNAGQLGILINWGRSVFETRDIQGVIEHIELAKSHRLLKGLMFSGVSDQPTDFGVWQDSHMPPAKSSPQSYGIDESLMTEAEIHRCMAAADCENLTVLGIKLGIRPFDTSIDDRIGYNREALAMLDRCLSHT